MRAFVTVKLPTLLNPTEGYPHTVCNMITVVLWLNVIENRCLDRGGGEALRRRRLIDWDVVHQTVLCTTLRDCRLSVSQISEQAQRVWLTWYLQTFVRVVTIVYLFYIWKITVYLFDRKRNQDTQTNCKIKMIQIFHHRWNSKKKTENQRKIN